MRCSASLKIHASKLQVRHVSLNPIKTKNIVDVPKFCENLQVDQRTEKICFEERNEVLHSEIFVRIQIQPFDASFQQQFTTHERLQLWHFIDDQFEIFRKAMRKRQKS
jgi:hypothetical protein